MDPQARKEFDLRVGTDEFQLHHAIEKMKLYGEKRYDLYTIQQLIPEDTAVDIWKLGNAVCAGNVKEMMDAKTRMIENGQTLKNMIPLLSSQLIRAYDVLCLYDQGYDESTIAVRLHVKDYAVRMNLQRLYRRSSGDILQIMMRLADLEQKMKAGLIEGNQEFDLFLYSCEVR
jgi:DNA polymerase-3 subunit delta